MSLSDSEWKDWAWIKAQGRERPAFWASVAVWLVLGSLPVDPVYITKGEGHNFYGGRFPLFFTSFFDPLGRLPLVITHVVLSGFLGLVIWRMIEQSNTFDPTPGPYQVKMGMKARGLRQADVGRRRWGPSGILGAVAVTDAPVFIGPDDHDPCVCKNDSRVLTAAVAAHAAEPRGDVAGS